MLDPYLDSGAAVEATVLAVEVDDAGRTIAIVEERRLAVTVVPARLMDAVKPGSMWPLRMRDHGGRAR